MHLPPASSVQMINYKCVTTEVFVNWLPHFTYFQVTSPCMLKFDEATSHQVHSTATHQLQPMDVPLDHFNIIGMNKLRCFTTATQDHTVIKQRYGIIFIQGRERITTPPNIKAKRLRWSGGSVLAFGT